MNKTFCDACGDEVSFKKCGSLAPAKIKIQKSVIDLVDGKDPMEKLSFGDPMINFDLCGQCKINVASAAYKVIKLTKETVKT